jgi:hypothetical protein
MDARRPPALARLDILVGRWTVQPKVDGLGAAWSEFSWVEDGAFLRQITDVDAIPDSAPPEWQANAPFPTVAHIGLDDTAEAYTMLYADSRAVYRVYQMTFTGREWTMLRLAEGFNQRFVATLSDDRNAIDGRWEMSPDGENWHVDFGLAYTRVTG